MTYFYHQLLLVATFVAIAPAFADKPAQMIKPTWHEKFQWNAKDYFSEPKVIALCKAIEANDLELIDRLVAEGADVNAVGKGNMTPLLWAYPDNKPERFKKLLEHGADPNVIVESDFNTRMSGIRPGDSVTHMVCKSWFPKYFDYVFQHGGNPNLWNRDDHETPIFMLIRGPAKEKEAKLQRLIDLRADIDANIDNEYTGGRTPVITATSAFGQYNLALQLLEAGADYKTYLTTQNKRLIHIVVKEENRQQYCTPQQKADYKKLVRWLEDHGESVKEARADIERWKSWSKTTGEFKRKMDAEIAKRKTSENEKQDNHMVDKNEDDH